MMSEQQNLTADDAGIIWRKPFSFTSTRDSEACLQRLRDLHRSRLKFIPVLVTIADREEVPGTTRFRIESRYGFIKGWIFGEVVGGEATAVRGEAGIDPQLLLILGTLAAIALTVFFSSPATSPPLFFMLLLIALIVFAVIVAGCLILRRTFVAELSKKLM